jgi:hypothetical protein
VCCAAFIILHNASVVGQVLSRVQAIQLSCAVNVYRRFPDIPWLPDVFLVLFPLPPTE